MYSKRNSYYNNTLHQFANNLRKSMTKAEACLWKYVLRAGMMKNYQFRRQRPVLSYIADFMCIDLKLIIEVDGITHNNEEQLIKDAIRQNELELHGFKVIRFQDDEVLRNIEGVRVRINDVIEEILNPPPAPPPADDIITPNPAPPPAGDNITLP